ncbi:MAG: hypothetical protein M1816_001902 [Peltula sp. TS41687]|nr:MAG: hypothetical protein M1816_001902 [Peltula sp. TS41687]
MLVCHAQLFLFGGKLPWAPSDWTNSDDSVRGGTSQSYLEICATDPSIARFYGQLDFQTLGGAGFASQRTTGDDRSWDLTGYDGIEIDVVNADDKTYTFTITNSLLPPDESTGREQSTLIYEYDFNTTSTTAAAAAGDDKTKEKKLTSNADANTADDGEDKDKDKTTTSTKIYIPWDKLKATYRGREQPDAPGLNLKDVKRLSLMIRSFFGKQQGDFSLSIRSIAAFAKNDCAYYGKE